jgi:hypothetical protein
MHQQSTNTVLECKRVAVGLGIQHVVAVWLTWTQQMIHLPFLTELEADKLGRRASLLEVVMQLKKSLLAVHNVRLVIKDLILYLNRDE